MVSGLGRAIQIIVPGVRVELVVSEEKETGSVKLVRTGLCGKTFHASCGSAKFGGNGRRGYLELA